MRRTGGSRASRRPGAGPHVARAAALAVLAASYGCGEGEIPDTGRPDDVPPRSVAAARWDTVFRVGGRERDTVFLQASAIAADGDGVSVADGYSGRVVRLDTAGRTAWSFGRRGAGPDEFRRPRDLAMDRQGRTWVLDVLNRRLTVVERDGRPAFRVPLDGLDRPVDGMALLEGDRAVLFTLAGERPFVAVDRNGGVVGRWAVPWPGFARLDRLATQMNLASAPGGTRWGAAFGFGDGFYLFGPDGEPAARGWLAEPVPFPGVSVRTSGSPLGRSTRTTRVERPSLGAVSVTMSRERLYVLFGGRGPGANRWIDSYDLADGSYAGSFLLPRAVNAMAHGAGTFYVTYDAPFPALAALRPVDGRAP